MGINITVAAVALGASVIEKHFTLDRNMEGPDHKASLEPDELKSMVEAIRNTEQALGDGIKRPVNNELEVSSVARKSLVAADNISKDTVITDELITVKRPGNGIAPEFLPVVTGMTIQHDKIADEVIFWEDFKK